MRKQYMGKIQLCFLVITIAFLIFSLNSVLALPYGGSVTQESTSTAAADAPGNNNAYAGNITEISVTGYATTQTWQGYMGNVTGVIQLADSSDNVMYNWTSLSPRGEIYSSTNDTIDWNYIQCFNFTADGTYSDDTANAGATSAYGKNYTQLESDFGILSDDDVDSVTGTFVLNDHEVFYTNSLEFVSGECKNVKLYNNAGVGIFDEVLMYEPTTASVIFNSIINRDANGFDNGTHDFQMLVLDNGHGTDLAPTNYYFYMELS